MDINLLETYLVSQLFAVLLVFARMGSALITMPGFAEPYISIRARLLLSLAFSFALAPFLEKFLPALPDDPFHLAIMLLGEIAVGLMMGTVARFLMSMMHVAGMIISFQSSLALATQFDTTQASQGSVFGNFLSLSAVLYIFALDLHHVLLRGVADSYTMFTPGELPPFGDMSEYLSILLQEIFEIGVLLASPFIVVGLLLYLAAGILARLMPNMQVFFVIMPLQLLLSFFVMMAVFSSMMVKFIGSFTDIYAEFLQGL
jgi:flagellar biosynthesis protein FliR